MVTVFDGVGRVKGLATMVWSTAHRRDQAGNVTAVISATDGSLRVTLIR